MEFKRLNQVDTFMHLLPLDWQESLYASLQQNRTKAVVYILEEDDEVFAGGLIFSSIIPEMDAYKEEANNWFTKGYLYIGYVWVPVKHRYKSYGSLWLKNLFLNDPTKQYWLTTEEHELRSFYQKNGFVFVKTLENKDVEEDLFIYPLKS